MAKKLFVKNYGCQMNVYDSARMADTLAPFGYRLADAPEDADLIILNTCHIREKAAEKVYSELGRLKLLKASPSPAPADDGSRPLIAVAGCVAQAEGAEILRRAPYVDMVLGPQTYHRLPELVEKAVAARSAGRGGVIDIDFPMEPKFDSLPPPADSRGPSAFVTIQEGCDRFCTFCVVPYTRGAEYSRPAGDVIDEVSVLAAAGAREVTLLGQNVNAYHGAGIDDGGLAGLIRSVGDIPGIERIRYTTSHPRDLGEDLISAHGDVPQLMPCLHLPVQSGSDRVLGLMNRGHDVADYLRLVAALRQARPGIALSSDFIVGYPGETDAYFDATMGLVREVDFAQAYSFKFSPRPGTPAAEITDQVPEAVKSERLAVLQALLNDRQLAFNRSWCGKIVPVLFDRRGRGGTQLAGRSPHMQAVHVDCPDDITADALFGTIADVRIEAASANSLTGVINAPAKAIAPPQVMMEPAEA